MNSFTRGSVRIALASCLALSTLGLWAAEPPKANPPADSKAPATAAPAPEAGSGSAMPADAAGSGTSMMPAEKPANVPGLGKDGRLDLGEVSFQSPKDWVWEEPASAMRKAQAKLPRAEGDNADGELAIFYFGPQSGSVEDNVARWCSQFEQPDGSPSDKAAKREMGKADKIGITMVDLSGTMKSSQMPGAAGPKLTNYRMLAAIAETPSGPWYAKATGPAKTIEKISKDFKAFAFSVKAK